MKYVSVFAVAAIAATGWTDLSVAQSSSKVVPAEFPPASYNGRQYVDSTGCVFIRAGIDNNVTWVPRLTRGRQQVCGFRPSLSAASLASVNASRATSATTVANSPEVTVQQIDKSIPEPKPAPRVASVPAAQPAPAPAPRVAATPAPAPRVVSKPAVAPKPASAPKPAAVAAAPAPAPAKPKPSVTAEKKARASVPTACSNRSKVAQQYLVSRGDDIRCGPQTQPHVTIKDGPPSPDATYYTHGSQQASNGQVRVAPKHVYEEQLASTDGVSVPEGYEVVWNDDRLNPKRTHQTLAGKAQMDQIWTKRVPRTLKPGVTGGSHVSAAAGGVPSDVVTEVSRTNAVASSAALADVTLSSDGYVQIGAFTDPTKAKSAAQQLANRGLPTKMGPHKQGGKSYTLVIVGPYKTQSALEGGLESVRAFGYRQATLKR